MRPQLLMWAVGIFILGTLLACITSGRWLLSGELNIINALASFETKSFGTFASPSGLQLYWNAMVTAFSWNYPFLSSPWAIIIKIPLWLVTIGVIWAIIEVGRAILQGALSAIRTIIG